MPSILELLEKSAPATSKANLKGLDRTPIGYDDPSGEYNPSKNLINDIAALRKARHGDINTSYSADAQASGILEAFQKTPPNTSKANFRGLDRTPIGDDDPTGEFSPSKNLVKDVAALKKARHGDIPTKKYSENIGKK